ncbi:hypothetical protein JZ751_001458 [Albula glossodonta]|uniref:Uncharacterized protein n=1 Tax=Albula glossodonta TaxID=121402 RepID=A0A8T2PTQ9_9TELE|nr:hypothetical protein JZ751_001458 [Albula glossodonta]
MLPSPVTSTPFSVKDILKLEQQQSHVFHQHGLFFPEHDLAPMQSPQSLHSALGNLDMLYSPEKPTCAEGEQVKSHINTEDFDILRGSCGSPTEEETDPNEDAVIAIYTKQQLQGQAPAALTIRWDNRRYKCKRQRQDKSLELAGHPPPPRRVAVPVLVRDGKPCLGGSQAYAGPYNVTVGSYPYNTYYSGCGNNPYSCNYPGVPPMPNAQTTSHIVNMNLAMGSADGHLSQQGHFQATLQGIRAW